jgi:hypothetical protein
MSQLYISMFHLFQTYVASVSFGYCKTKSGFCIYMHVSHVFSYVCCMCFILMFAMATHVFSCVFWCFVSVSEVCSNVSAVFGRKLQVFFLNVAKIDKCCVCCSTREKRGRCERSPHVVGRRERRPGMQAGACWLKCGRGVQTRMGETETECSAGVWC